MPFRFSQHVAQLLLVISLCLASCLSIDIQAELNKPYWGLLTNSTSAVYSFHLIAPSPEEFVIRIGIGKILRQYQSNYPILVVVKQSRTVLSFEVPLVTEYVSYNNVSRILCPVTVDGDENSLLTVELSTASPGNQPVHYKFIAERIVGFDLRPISYTLYPAQPTYFRFKFDNSTDSVNIRAASPDSICMIFSLQLLECPVGVQAGSVQRSGFYQSASQLGSISTNRRIHGNGVYVVTTLADTDMICNHMETIHQAAKDSEPTIVNLRTKNVTLSVWPEPDVWQYFLPVGAILFFYLLFYAIAAMLICLCSALDKQVSNERIRSILDVDPTPSRYNLHYRHLINQQSSGPSTSSSYPVMTSSSLPSHRKYRKASKLPLVDQQPLSFSVSQLPVAARSDGDGMNGDDARSVEHAVNPVYHSWFSSTDDDDSDNEQHELDMPNGASSVADVATTIRRTRHQLTSQVTTEPVVLHAGNNGSMSTSSSSLPTMLPRSQQSIRPVLSAMLKTGDEDMCYYNFECARPLGLFFAFNNIISNLGYVMLGVLFLFLTTRRDMQQRKRRKANPTQYQAHNRGIPQYYGLYYAMGFALVMEGIMSAGYHMCPSFSNFQFDTAYMYILAILIVVKIYQIRHPDINASAHSAYMVVAFVIFLSVLGVLYSSEAFWVAFTAFFILLSVIVTAEVYYMGQWNVDLFNPRRLYQLARSDGIQCIRPLYTERMITLFAANFVNVSIAIYGIVFQPNDFNSFLLAIFMINDLMYTAFYLIFKLRYSERIRLTPILFMIASMCCWIPATYFFFHRVSTWELTPAQSRARNQPCILLNFYDHHDVWHMLSSISMFFSFMMLMHLDDDLQDQPRDTIVVF